MAHKYEHVVDLDSDTSAARIVRLVGPKKRVLDIGAGPGSITRVLKDVGQCQVSALELDPAAITQLSQFCDQVYQVDLNSAGWPSLLSGHAPFDVIVAADVLEHLYDPWLVLQEMASLIGPEGYIVISIPHVAHCAVVACLLQETFAYRPWGLLDSTHIRFFGIHDTQALLDRAGLKILAAQFVLRAPESTEFAEQWERLPRRVRRVLLGYPFGFVYQIVMKAVPVSRPGEPVQLASLPIKRPKPPKRVFNLYIHPRVKKNVRRLLPSTIRQWIGGALNRLHLHI